MATIPVDTGARYDRQSEEEEGRVPRSTAEGRDIEPSKPTEPLWPLATDRMSQEIRLLVHVDKRPTLLTKPSV
jgi:hypothetical protein